MDSETLQNKSVSAFVESCMGGRFKAARKMAKESPGIIDVECALVRATALQGAAEFGHTHIARWLVANGAELNRRGRGGNTAMHLAARAGRQEMLRFLVDAGANRRIRNDAGLLPIELAMEFRRDDCIYLFRDVPSCPTNVRLGAGENAAHCLYFCWDAPESNGGEKIVEYECIVKSVNPSIGFDVKVLVKGLSAAVPDCRPACDYRVQICAINKVGSGSPSAEVILQTDPAPPDMPEAPKVVKTTSKSLTMGWARLSKEQMNGRRVTWWELQMRRSTGSSYSTAAKVSQAVQEFVIKDLRPGESFYFRIRAKNGCGWSLFSSDSQVVRTNRAAVLLARGPRGVHLQWEAPFIDGNRFTGKFEAQRRRVLSRREILRHKHLQSHGDVTLSQDELGQWVSAGHSEERKTEGIFEGLNPHTPYMFRLRRCSVQMVRASFHGGKPLRVRKYGPKWTVLILRSLLRQSAGRTIA